MPIPDTTDVGELIRFFKKDKPEASHEQIVAIAFNVAKKNKEKEMQKKAFNYEGEDEGPQTGPEAILYALKNTKIEDLEKRAREDLASGKKTKRNGAVALLNIVKGMKRNNQEPADYMIKSVPVIPTKYRPFSAQGGAFIPGDANVLYKDLFDIRDAHNEELKMFGPAYSGQSRLDLYDAVKSVYGYGDPVKAKTKAKDVKGFLQKITGTTSKFGFVNRKLLSKTQDNTGRSTIIVEPDYGIDDIGIPEPMAFKMYAPYIQRRLKMSGMRDAEALRHVREQTKEARMALEREMQERPVIYSRAPAWHDKSFLAAKPKLVKGAAIHTNPYVAVGLNADYDGNCIIGSSQILLKIDKTKISDAVSGHSADYDELLIKIGIDNSEDAWYTSLVMQQNTAIIKKDTTVAVVINIKDMPHLKDTVRLDSHGAKVYDVPDGIEVLTSTPEGGTRWERVETFTEEEGCVLKRVTTTRGTEVVCSENESLATFNPEGGLRRIKPEDVIVYKTDKDGKRVPVFSHAVPIIQKFPTGNIKMQHGFDLGWLIGVFVSDGTYDGNLITFAKESSAIREKFISRLALVTGDANMENYAATYSEMHQAVTNYGISGMSTKIHIRAEKLPMWLRTLFSDCYNQDKKTELLKSGERSCLSKKLPADFIKYDEDILFGILCGLIDGDGCISLNKSKKRSKPQFLCNISTSSTFLRDDIIRLGRMLGVLLSYSTTPAKETRIQTHDNYTVTISNEWLWKVLDKINIVSNYDALNYLRENKPNCSAVNVAPVSYDALLKLEKAYPEVKTLGGKYTWHTDKSKAKKFGYDLFTRDRAQQYAKLIMEHIPGYKDDPALLTVVNAAMDDTVAWVRYKSVEDAPTETVYDIGVPGAKVFALESGMIVYDTINVHVPSSPAAVKEALDVMMASKTPFSDRSEGKLVPLPKQEQVLGLYTAATAPTTQKFDFLSEQDAIAAIRQGKVPLSADVTIRGKSY